MRLFLLLLLLVTLPGWGQPIHPLAYVLASKTTPNPEMMRRAVSCREEFITLSQVGRYQCDTDIPVLLHQREINALRATPIYMVTMDSLDSDILAMYVCLHGQSSILLSKELLLYDKHHVDDIITHEFIHEADKLLGDARLGKPALNLDSAFSDVSGYVPTLLRTELKSPYRYLAQIDSMVALVAITHVTDTTSFVENVLVMRGEMRYVALGVWDQRAYFTDAGEVFTRYLMLKRWLLAHGQLASLYEPLRATHLTYLLAHFPAHHMRKQPYMSNLFEQDFFPLFFFLHWQQLRP